MYICRKELIMNKYRITYPNNKEGQNNLSHTMKKNSMKTLFLTLSIVFSLVAYSQNKNNINNVKPVSIDIVEVDAKFYSLLDSLLKNDCKCSYYSDTLYYGIWIDKTISDKGDHVIVISIVGNTQKEFFFKDRHRESLFGYFLYKRHNFFLFGSNILESIIVTNKKKIFQYSDYYPDEDDRWTIYRFLYYNKKYMLYEKENDWLCK